MRAVIPIFLAAAAASHAGTVVDVTFFPATQSGLPGDLLSFSGRIVNNTNATVFINADSFVFAISGVVDDSPFLLNAPLSLGPMEASALFAFLDISVPLGQAPGMYDGVLTVLGGVDGNASDNLGTAAFQGVVNTSAPEPELAAFVAFAIGAMYLVRRFRHAAFSMPDPRRRLHYSREA
jgi:hypothetical protein